MSGGQGRSFSLTAASAESKWELLLSDLQSGTMALTRIQQRRSELPQQQLSRLAGSRSEPR
ncbi:hypothetical protein EYF80_041432 [Liparis tanakae]|uniref:Uncharacterized protein n=1 Tax=Liparis tanakae TaxID=230148 RepID=A0A4Z2G655_9TELE|nr:hypothetical protein EYF80_041432 [Liparis tanakae]